MRDYKPRRHRTDHRQPMPEGAWIVAWGLGAITALFFALWAMDLLR